MAMQILSKVCKTVNLGPIRTSQDRIFLHRVPLAFNYHLSQDAKFSRHLKKPLRSNPPSL